MTLTEALDRLIAVLGEPSGVWYGHKHAWGAFWEKDEAEITLDDSCCGGNECECEQLFLQVHCIGAIESLKSYQLVSGCNEEGEDCFTPEKAAELANHFVEKSRNESMWFCVNKDEISKIRKWQNDHEAEHPTRQTAIGGRWRYCFVPTSLGSTIVVECHCGASFDATDYGSW